MKPVLEALTKTVSTSVLFCCSGTIDELEDNWNLRVNSSFVNQKPPSLIRCDVWLHGSVATSLHVSAMGGGDHKKSWCCACARSTNSCPSGGW